MLETATVQCPYCGELIDAVIDCSVVRQSYIEDCQVCCCPITFNVTVGQDGLPIVCVNREND
jgi:hypothetical protein